MMTRKRKRTSKRQSIVFSIVWFLSIRFNRDRGVRNGRPWNVGSKHGSKTVLIYPLRGWAMCVLFSARKPGTTGILIIIVHGMRCAQCYSQLRHISLDVDQCTAPKGCGGKQPDPTFSTGHETRGTPRRDRFPISPTSRFGSTKCGRLLCDEYNPSRRLGFAVHCCI